MFAEGFPSPLSLSTKSALRCRAGWYGGACGAGVVEGGRDVAGKEGKNKVGGGRRREEGWLDGGRLFGWVWGIWGCSVIVLSEGDGLREG